MRKHCIWRNGFWPITVATVLLLLQLVSGDQQAEDHRIQRRFMWHQMDNTVMGGIMGSMFNGARAMKTMFTGILPSTASYAKTMLDFLPTETTRVKYIIRDPHTNKPMKIIKMRGSQKKVVKLKRPMPKPVVTEPTQLQYENRMRQLEKEQELIVEGRAPMSSDEALMNKYFKPKTHPSNSNEIVSGKIMEYQSWKPVYKSGEQPTSYVTLRPQPLTQLHTHITSSNQVKHNDYGSYNNHELLPKPEKLVGHMPDLEDEEDDFEQVGDENDLFKQTGHQYEVTEHTGEASGEVQSLATMEGGFVPSHLYHSSNSGSNPSSSSSMSSSSGSSISQIPRPRSRGIIIMSTTSTSTTEAPNYPPAFLKKYREREANANLKAIHKVRPKHHQHKEQILTDGNPQSNVSFALSTLRARLQEQQRKTKHEERDAEMEAALVEAMEGDKWPTEVQQSGDYLTSPIGPSAVAFEQPLNPPRNEYKRPRANLRQRGSIKFNDNPNEEM
ncbi:uncharacterized protein LOC6559359 [Drosophila grimshawi]|uniref:uncharacterized protein LOC6559359 n=1 Tax=Drosophila grimshawi TaxID=7222 RepID=UPI001C93707D|nr:uncharacterized protein LOC6559359 [Drosophila grimshawi]